MKQYAEHVPSNSTRLSRRCMDATPMPQTHKYIHVEAHTHTQLQACGCEYEITQLYLIHPDAHTHICFPSSYLFHYCSRCRLQSRAAPPPPLSPIGPLHFSFSSILSFSLFFNNFQLHRSKVSMALSSLLPVLVNLRLLLHIFGKQQQ